MISNDYGGKERILFLDKLFRFDDEHVFRHVGAVRVNYKSAALKNAGYGSPFSQNQEIGKFD